MQRKLLHDVPHTQVCLRGSLPSALVCPNPDRVHTPNTWTGGPYSSCLCSSSRHLLLRFWALVPKASSCWSTMGLLGTNALLCPFLDRRHRLHSAPIIFPEFQRAGSNGCELGKGGGAGQRRNSQEPIVAGLLGGPVSFHCKGCRFDPWWKRRSHMLSGQRQDEIRQKETMVQPWVKVLVLPQWIHITTSLSYSVDTETPAR